MDLDTKKLRRPWWTTPLIITSSIVAIFYLLGWIVVGMINGGQPAYKQISVGAWPLYVGLFFGLCGMMAGRNFSSAAAETIGGHFGVRYLKADHWLTQRVHSLAAQLGLPPPAVGLVNVVNAFAMGPSPDKAAVVLGIPLVKGLSSTELDAVIGHELGHVISGDMTRMQFAEGYARTFRVSFGSGAAHAVRSAERRATNAQGMIIALVIKALLWIFMTLLSIGSQIAVKGLSRKREFFADAIGAAVSSPEAMMGALRKLHNPNIKTSAVETEYGCLMFKGAGSLKGLFSTHPTLESRLNALETQSHLNMLPLKSGAAPMELPEVPATEWPKVDASPAPPRPQAAMRQVRAEPQPSATAARPAARTPKPAQSGVDINRPRVSPRTDGAPSPARDAYRASLAKMLSEIEQTKRRPET
ncbi:M48 family metalloprotease [Nitrobacter sp. JJSN]|uniref:M48 family metalloprotease n=1 Tax=Nitrobacter sp. JJSN TaxID=3453033 RepID=UPI003F75779F